MKAWLLLGLMVASTVLGDVLQSMEMKRHGEIRDFDPRGLGKVAATLARRKYLILAVVFMAVTPGPQRWHYRRLINSLVYQALD